MGFIADIYEEKGPFDSIIELGCGNGRNIFDLFYGWGGPLDVKYYGGEYTESGVKIAQELVDADVSFFHFNHLTPVLNIEVGEKALVFTCHSVEQVHLVPDNWFSVVAGVAPQVTCVHFEPFGFQFRSLGPASEEHKKFFERNQWNINFAKVFSEAVKKEEINMETCMLETFYPSDPSNPTSLAIWTLDKRENK